MLYIHKLIMNKATIGIQDLWIKIISVDSMLYDVLLLKSIFPLYTDDILQNQSFVHGIAYGFIFLGTSKVLHMLPSYFQCYLTDYNLRKQS